MPDSYTIDNTKAVIVGADQALQKTLYNRGPGSFYYKATSDVSSSDTEVASGSSVTFTSTQFIISASASNITQIPLVGQTVQDSSVSDDLTVGDAVTLGTGGIDPISAPKSIVNIPITIADTGTNTTPADGTQFVTSIFVPCNKTITSIGYLVGDTGGTDKVYAALYSNSGALLGNSSVTTGGATVGTANTVQTLNLTSTYAAKGPANYFVGVSVNGTTARLNTVAANTGNGVLAGSVSQTHGTVAAITPPSTFTADKAPYIVLA